MKTPGLKNPLFEELKNRINGKTPTKILEAEL